MAGVPELGCIKKGAGFAVQVGAFQFLSLYCGLVLRCEVWSDAARSGFCHRSGYFLAVKKVVQRLCGEYFSGWLLKFSAR